MVWVIMPGLRPRSQWGIIKGVRQVVKFVPCIVKFPAFLLFFDKNLNLLQRF